MIQLELFLKIISLLELLHNYSSQEILLISVLPARIMVVVEVVVVVVGVEVFVGKIQNYSHTGFPYWLVVTMIISTFKI